MKILLTGANGQLGCCFKDRCPDDWELVAVNHCTLDITNLAELDRFISKQKFDVIVNAAAYTAVDKAETESELAKQVNELGPKYLAIIAEKYNIKLVHVSTDYVFDGDKNTPYFENDTTHPINVYGLTKRNGEVAVLENNASAIVIRTSWVFSEYGSNFVKTMLKLATTKPNLAVIYDQIGCPTYAGDIAMAIIIMLKKNVLGGIYHYCGNDATSWFDFASIIFDIAFKQGILVQIPKIKAIATKEYPTLAKRPLYSILNTDKLTSLGIVKSDWETALNTIIPAMSL